MGGGSSTQNIASIDERMAARQQNAQLVVAVEEFTEQAYLDGSKVDGLKIVLTNPNARKAFIKFLNTENGGENLKFFQDMEYLRQSKESDIATEAQSLVASYQKPAVVADEGVTDQVSANINNILATPSAPVNPASEDAAAGIISDDDQSKADSADDFLMQAVYNASNETMVIIALNVFPNFIGSQAYKDWREQEAQLAQEKIATDPVPSTPAVSTTTTAAAASEVGTVTVAESFANKSAQFVNPSQVDRLFGNGSWIGAFVSAAEGLPICVTLADADQKNPNFPLLYVNKVFESTTGFPRERIRGTNCKFLQGPKTEPESISLLSNALANQQPVKVAITNYRLDKTPFKNLLAMKPVFDLDGRYCYVVGVQFDISAPGSNAKAMKLVDSLISLLPNVVPSGGGF